MMIHVPKMCSYIYSDVGECFNNFIDCCQYIRRFKDIWKLMKSCQITTYSMFVFSFGSGNAARDEKTRMKMRFTNKF